MAGDRCDRSLIGPINIFYGRGDFRDYT